MKRVIVTGATGFLGKVTAQRMREAGWDVITTGRNETAGAALRETGFPFTSCDLARDGETFTRLVQGCDLVIHCAALSRPWGKRADFVSANVLATGTVLAACEATGARLISISSPSVTFEYHTRRSLREDAPWTMPAANHYIATKREAEKLVRNCAAVSSVILRPKAIIGPGDTTLLPRVIRTARKGFFPIFPGSEARLDLTAVEDVAEGIRLTAEAGEAIAGNVYHLTGGDPIPAAEAFALLFEACGLKVRDLPIRPETALFLAGFLETASRVFTAGKWEPPVTRYSIGSLIYEQSLDISAARRDLGYDPKTDLRKTLIECGKRWKKANLLS
ncbi:MAG TPA: NAD-dependent epimerase/dehydratase family protein [Verrucomicrobiales bacterium]|jgi:nucleoside-diphosphate-sugar epimerase|nr:NAD-dependent epimerase/dehydratase family protein [Verrucomicrobiales bacterium]